MEKLKRKKQRVKLITVILVNLVGILALVTPPNLNQAGAQIPPGEGGPGYPALSGFWPMFQHDNQHTGRSSFVGSQTNNIKWRFLATGYFRSSPVIGSDETIYFGPDNNFYALNPNGSIKWSYSVESFLPHSCCAFSASSPAIGSDGTIYTGTNILNTFYAFNPDGTVKWEYTVDDGIISSPVVTSDNKIYVGSLSGTLYAFNSDGTLQWNLPLDGDFPIGSPAVSLEGTIYVNTSKNFYAISPNGSIKCSYPIGPSTFWWMPTPSIASDGTIYTGDSGIIYAFDSNCSIKWKSDLSYLGYGYFGAGISIGSDETLYVGVGNVPGSGGVIALYPNGDLKWEYKTIRSAILSAPAIGADGTIYVSAGDNTFYAINPDGLEKWSYLTEIDMHASGSSASPAIGMEGTVYMGSEGKLYAFASEAIPENQPPDKPTELKQFKSDGTTQIGVGDTTNEDTVVFKSRVSDPDGDKVKLEIELRRLGEYEGKFLNEPSPETISDLVDSGSGVTITRGYLVDGDYHWQARAVDENGNESNWVQFGENDISDVDFTVDVGFIAGSIDISVSDSPDPFNPYEGETNTITINNIGNNPCGKVTLSIDNTGRNWEWSNLVSGDNVQAIWDGRDNSGNIVASGIYNYTAFAEQHHSPYFSDTETGTITVEGEAPPENQPPILLVHEFQLGCFNPNEIWKEMIKTLTGVEIEFINTGLQITTPNCGTEEIKIVKPTDNVRQIGLMDERGVSMIRVEGNGFVVYTSNYAQDTFSPTFNDIRDYAENLAEEIQFIKNIEDVYKVDIVAHSMGGLIARSYIEINDLKTLLDAYDYGELAYNNDVRKLVVLGTPNHGIPFEIVVSLFRGIECGISCWKDPTKFTCVKCLAEIEDCADRCLRGNDLDECNECLKGKVPDSIWQMLAEGPFLITLNTPNLDFDIEYSAIAGNYCDIAGVACFRELLFPVGDGRVTVKSVLELNEIPKVMRFIYPAKHSELINWIVPVLTVKDILSEESIERIGGFEFSRLYSPGELRVYDSQGRVTGLVEGEIKEEIPNSMYDAENKTVVIFDPFDNYRYEVVGTDEGTYGLTVTSVEDGETTVFTAIDIPTAPGEIHQYTIDWDVLSQGGEGTTLKIDLDGDGEVDETKIVGSSLDMGEAKLEEKIAITKMTYGGEDILNGVTLDVGDGAAPLLLSELKEASVDLEDYTSSGRIMPGKTKKLKMKFKFLESAGNEYQGKSINVKFKFLATQEEK